MLRRLPWWGWLAVNCGLLFAVHNPWGASLWRLWAEGLWPLPVRALATAALLLTIGLLCAATWRSIGLAGVLTVAGLAGLLVWVAVAYGALDPGSGIAAEVLPQLLGGAVLTIGLRWPAFRRAVSGVVAVDGGADQH